MAIVRPRIPAPPAAVLLRDHQTEQPGVAEDLEHVLRIGRVGVDLAGAGGDLLLRQLADGRLQLEVLGGQIERHRTGILPMGRVWLRRLRRATMQERAAGGSVSTTDERDGSPLETSREVAADGDDIVVITEPDSGRRRRRDGVILIVTVVVVLLAGLGIAVALRGRSSHTTVRTTSTTVARVSGIAAPPVPTSATAPRASPTTTTAVVAPVTSPPVTAGPRVTTAVVAPGPSAPPATVAAPPTAPPPKQYGPSVLTWSAPHSMTVVEGTSAILAVAAHNHTDGTVTLPHPLSCGPRLDHSEICPEVVQLVAHGTSAGAQYTIDARGIAPGHYTLRIEGVLTVAVTVRAAP